FDLSSISIESYTALAIATGPHFNPHPDGIEMCNYYKNYYIYATCNNPSAHFLRSEMEGSKDNSTCKDSPHDRFIVVVGKCILCTAGR
ncbi:unnamed protein product, partial [Penicillium salamii]